MTKAGSLEKGMAILIKGEPFIVVEREFVKPGKGSAFVRTKLKNPNNGQVLRETMKTQDQVEEVLVEDKDCQFLYADADAYHFMDLETYEQFEVPLESFPEYLELMKEGETFTLIMWENRPLDIKLPFKVVYTVTKAEDAVRGDTVTGATKTVEVETGLKVKVPIFIKEGEKILVNTESRDYVERVNQ
jgi:elongation factor P